MFTLPLMSQDQVDILCSHFVDTEIEPILTSGIIRRSSSPFASLTVTRKDNSIRLCINFLENLTKMLLSMLSMHNLDPLWYWKCLSFGYCENTESQVPHEMWPDETPLANFIPQDSKIYLHRTLQT